jgi:predicted permease
MELHKTTSDPASWRAYVREHLPPLAGDSSRNAAVIEELATQLQDLYEAAIRGGASAEEAQACVHAEVTDWDALARDLTQAHNPAAAPVRSLVEAVFPRSPGLPFAAAFGALMRDTRHAVRSLRGQPLVTSTTLLTFALGIGATTVAFALVQSVLLRPLPYREPDRLVWVQQTVPEIAHQYPMVGVNARSFTRWQESCRTSCDSMAAFAADVATLTGMGEPEGLVGARVSPSLFEVIGVGPVHGRAFTAAEADPGNDRVVMLSYDFWQRRFGGDRGVIGRTIRLDDVPLEIVGVLSSTFRFPEVAHRDLSGRIVNAPAYLRPLGWSEEQRTSWGEYDNAVVLRLRDGASVEAARAELTSLTSAEFAQAPIHPFPVVEPLAATITSDARRPLWLLLGAVLSALLIACVNVSNLLLARWMTRRREFAIRTAVGASRAHLASLVGVESVLLAATGGLLGAAGAWLALDAIVARVPLAIPRLHDVRLDMTALAFAAGLTGVCAVLCSVLPAWRAAGVAPGDTLKAAARTTTDSGRWAGVRRWLVSAEVALTTMLLVVGGLLLASFVNVLRVEPGFSTTAIVAIDLTLPGARYPDAEARARFFDQLLDTLEEVPGIESAGLARKVPLEGEGAVDAFVRDGDARPISEQPIASHVQVSPDYLRTIDVTLVHGRLLTAADRGRDVAVISERAARAVWSSPQDAVGRRFTRGNRDVSWEIVGVVADARLRGLEQEPGLVAYVPYGPKDTQSQLSLVVRTRPDLAPAAVVGRIRDAVQSLDPQLPLQRTRTLVDVLDRALGLRRFQLHLVVAFAAVGLLLACIGIYGVSASGVERRRNELAIRLALGASSGGVRRLVVGQGLAPVCLGLAVGLVLGVGAARVVGATLFGVTPDEPIVIGTVAAGVLVVAIAACLEPAIRAARVPLASTLRSE